MTVRPAQETSEFEHELNPDEVDCLTNRIASDTGHAGVLDPVEPDDHPSRADMPDVPTALPKRKPWKTLVRNAEPTERDNNTDPPGGVDIATEGRSLDHVPNQDLPLLVQVHNPQMLSAESRFWNAIRLIVRDLEGLLDSDSEYRERVEIESAIKSSLIGLANQLIQIPAPARWSLCSGCEGQGESELHCVCSGCEGRGYQYKEHNPIGSAES